MKKLLLLILTIISTIGLFANFLNEGFDGSTFPPAEWRVINNGDANTWALSNTQQYSGSGCAGIYWAGATAAHDDWLITPQLIPSADNYMFIFGAKNYTTLWTDRFNVKLSTTGNNAADFTVTLASNVTPIIEYQGYHYDLSAYIGRPVYIAIQAISTGGYWLLIDQVTGPDLAPGTADNPIQITTAAELNNIRNYLGTGFANKYFKLMNDIDLTSYLAPGGAGYTAWGTNGWLPIGNSSNYFYGHFDGNNHMISNLGIHNYGAYHGLFGVTGVGSIVKNLALSSSCYILGDGDTGSVVGNNKGTVRNCSSAATINIGNATTGGGVVGNNLGTLTKSSFSGTITRSGSGVSCNKIGGVAGNNETGAVIDSCYSTGSISGNLWNGGLVGWNNGTINRSYSTGSVTGADNSQGGLVGQNNGIISNCYSRASASGGNAIGGLVGYQGSGAISYCFATGTTAGSSRGGLVGALSAGTVTSSYWDTQTTGLAVSSGSAASFGKTTAEMKLQSTYVGWDFAGETVNGTNDYWAMAALANDGYPFLNMEYSTPKSVVLVSPLDGAKGVWHFDYTLS